MSKVKKYKLDPKTYGKFKLIFYQGFGKKPKFLPKNGRAFKGCKHILETLQNKFGKFKFIITDQNKSKILKRGSQKTVYLAAENFREFQQAQFSMNRKMQFEIVHELFPKIYPKYFKEGEKEFAYEPGLFSEILTNDLRPASIARKDVDALVEFYPKIMNLDFSIKAEVEQIYKDKQNLQMIYLNKLISNYEKKLTRKYAESNWQRYFKKNLLFFQENYVKFIEKQNVDIEIKIPDFCVITSDEYLDVLEIKVPATKILSWDKSHGNYYWSPELSKAISQVEHYIDYLEKNSSKLKEIILKKFKVYVRVVRPRGIIIAGHSKELVKNESEEDFRLLNQGLKNVTVIPYDDLTKRLKNIISSMQELESKRKSK